MSADTARARWFFMGKRFYGGIAVGMIVLAAFGLNWVGEFGFGWVLGSQVEQMASEAVEERLAQLCVARVRQDPNTESALAELRSTQALIGWN